MSIKGNFNIRHMNTSHQHQYNQAGVCEICSQTAKVYEQAEAHAANKEHDHDHAHEHDHDHSHSSTGNSNLLRLFGPAILSLVLLLSGLALDYLWPMPWFQGYIRFAWYLAAYIPWEFRIKRCRKKYKKGKFLLRIFPDGHCYPWCFCH